jgi:hypothetical protein
MYTPKEVKTRIDIFGKDAPWISVFDWLPPMRHDVLVTQNAGLVHIGQRRPEVDAKGKQTGKWIWGDCVFTEPTHWMPLPDGIIDLTPQEFSKRLKEEKEKGYYVIKDEDHWWYYRK